MANKPINLYNKDIFVVILSLTGQINIPLQLQTDHFCVSVQMYKISRGSNIVFPRCIIRLFLTYYYKLHTHTHTHANVYFNIIMILLKKN